MKAHSCFYTRRPPSAVAEMAALAAMVALASCQPGMSTTPAVTPVPPLALGLLVFLGSEPTVMKIDDPAGRPLTMALQHDVRDALEEAGFKLAPSPDMAAGVVATVVIQRAGAIRADLFIHGAEACGVRLDIQRGDFLLATAEPDVHCISTSSYYGLLAKDAAVSLVNTVSHAPGIVAFAESRRAAAGAADASAPFRSQPRD